MRDQLSRISLLSFLDSYSEPAFILCANGSPQPTLSFIYGNSALQELVFGEGETAILNDSTFFNALHEEEDLQWLSNPHLSTNRMPGLTGASRTVKLRPGWLPRDHVPLQLELIATPITLPLTIHAVGSNARSFVFIASSRKASQQLFRTESINDAVVKHRSVMPQTRSTSYGSEILWQRRISTRSSASHRSRPSSEHGKPPSQLLHIFPWHETPLGPQNKWPHSLRTMVRYVMAKPVPVNRHSRNYVNYMTHNVIC
jgi:hypothetical protein